MAFDSVKIIFISEKLELLTLEKSLAFSGRFSPFISSRIACVLLKSQLWALSARALTLKSDWVGNDFTVARRFELLANHWSETTIDIVFQIRLQLVRAAANSQSVTKSWLSPQGRRRKQFWTNILVTGLMCLGFEICVVYWFAVGLTVYWNQCHMHVLSQIKRKKKINEARLYSWHFIQALCIPVFHSSSSEFERMASSDEFVVLLRQLY